MEKLKESPRQLSLPRALPIKLSVRRCKAVLLNHAGDLGGEVVLFLLVGLGGLDIAHYIERAEALSPDTPMIIEHLTGDAAYREAVARVQGIARAAGVALR